MDSSIKKILILSNSAGHGHLKAAVAIKSALKTLAPNAIVESYDALDFFPLWVKRLYVGSYVFMITRAHRLWSLSYSLADYKILYPLMALKRRIFHSWLGRKLKEKILYEKPDAVVVTHFMPAEVCAYLKRKGLLHSRCITVITDFLVHRFWIFKETDFYIVAANDTREALLQEGINSERILVNGIPVHPKFAIREDLSTMRRKLNISEDRFTILLTSGGTGAGLDNEVAPLKHLLENHKDFQALVVCGSNAALKKHVDEIASKIDNVYPFGFVDNMDELMDAADMVVGKAGGSTLSEALAKRKVFFILSPLPGQEISNTRVLTKAGAALWVRKYTDLPGMIDEYRRDEVVRQAMIKAIDEVSHPYAAQKAAEKILTMIV